MDFSTAQKHLRQLLAETSGANPVSLTREQALALADLPAAITVTRGDRVTAYEGMGEFTLGVVVRVDNEHQRIIVRTDGTVNPDGSRWEPADIDYAAGSVHADPDPTASMQADDARTKPGYSRIIATL